MTAAPHRSSQLWRNALTFLHKIEYIRIVFLESVFAALIIQHIECIEQCFAIERCCCGVIASGHNQLVQASRSRTH